MSEVELTIGGQAKEPSSIRLVLTLAIAGMISGFAIAGAYQITKPRIEANKARALREAVFQVVPGSSVMQKLVLRDGALVVLGGDEETDDPVVYSAYDEVGVFCGYALANDGAGFQDLIELLYGYDPVTKRVVGMRILASRETPGLGDKIFKDAAFVSIFDDLAVEPAIVVVKDGRDADHEVDSITGATISAKAVVKIINESNAFWLDQLPLEAPAYVPPVVEEGEGDE